MEYYGLKHMIIGVAIKIEDGLIEIGFKMEFI